MGRNKVVKNISKDEERDLYYVCLNWGKGADGKYVKTYVTATNKARAKEILKKHEADRAAGKTVLPTKLSLSAATEQYIAYKKLHLAETTIYGYQNILNNHIKSYFAEKPLQSVSLQDIQNYEIFKSETLSKNSVKKHLELLKSVFQDACRKRIINENPLLLMERRPKNTTRRECMNAQEIAELCASVEGTYLEALVVLAAYLGLRRGEVLGLRWSDVDFEAGVLHIVNTRTKAGGRVIEKDPKTETSNRVMLMSQPVIRALKNTFARRGAQRRMDQKYADSGYVVTKPDGSPFSPNYISEAFHKHLLKHNMKPIRYHDLRHSFASIANEAGTPIAETKQTVWRIPSGCASITSCSVRSTEGRSSTTSTERTCET